MNLHESGEVLTKGQELEEASRAVIMLHGRGTKAHSILELSTELPEAAYLAPQANKGTWYPRPFMEPRENNQPYLDSALEKVGYVLDKALEYLPEEKVVFLGFSQGACLASEFVVRNPQRYGGLVAFSGGLIGEELPEYQGDLESMPVFLGCSENDPHIPLSRVEETVDVFQDLDADVKKTIYEGSTHSVNEDEVEEARKIIGSL